ncbi:uncharacterized protein LOC130368044 [Hyla sarda]|uniref:uncharacterized protein LOC130368044 n=1 Tax=Hyla sarda TaxID=327740 RepID=UPI0024C2109B|nr:uncharacterized protein LOC130368044 [Hyla sarda]
MLPVFIVASMAVLGVSTVMAVFTNSFIIAVNIIDKIQGKSLSASDLIIVTLCISNIIFQFIMLVNDYVSFLETDLYFSDEVYVIFTVMIILPVYSSFWFTVCLSFNYYLQIIIFTNPFLIRLKIGISQLVPKLLLASVFIAMTTGVPAVWNFYRDSPGLNMSRNMTIEISVPKLNIIYLLPTNLLSCSLPLVLVGIVNGLIIKSLVTHTHKTDRNAKGDLSARAEGRVRAAMTISCLLILYLSFYISEILMFIDAFPPNSPGFCICLMVIYSYSPAQSIVLIFGSPKLKQISLSLLHYTGGSNKEKAKIPKVLFIKLGTKKKVPVKMNKNYQSKYIQDKHFCLILRDEKSKSVLMLPIFLLLSMTILVFSTIIGSLANSIIIAVNITDKFKGKALSPSDQILLMMGISNVLFQLIMTLNDFLSFLKSDFYFTKEVYILFSAIINFPVFTSFWLTACLSISYYFQIVIFTHPFLVRLKLVLFRIIPQLLMTSVLISLATCIPVIWNTMIYDQEFNMTGNASMEASSPTLTLEYLIISNLICLSLPLVLAGVTNGFIIKSLVTHTHKAVKNAKGDLSARTEGQVRAARTISCLLLIYISFYISELLLFTEMFPPSSLGLCVCYMIIYSYSPSQSIVLIFGSPKLKQAVANIIHSIQGFNEEVDTTPNVAFIKLNIKGSMAHLTDENKKQNTIVTGTLEDIGQHLNFNSACT